MWTDDDFIRGNDFEGVKDDWFGNKFERLIITGAQAQALIGTGDPKLKVLRFTGITIGTPNSDPDIAADPDNPGFTQTKATMTFKTIVTFNDADPISDLPLVVGSTTVAPGLPTRTDVTKVQTLAGGISVLVFEEDPSNKHIKTLIVKVPFIVLVDLGMPLAFDTINIPFSFDDSPDPTPNVPSASAPTTGDHSPKVQSTLQEMKAQWTHYGVVGHWLGEDCGPTGIAELRGNDFAIGLGCGIGPLVGPSPSVSDLTLDSDFGTLARHTFLGVPYGSGAGGFPTSVAIPNPQLADPDGIPMSGDERSVAPTRGYPLQFAGTFVHELGHNFALDHGGPQNFMLKEWDTKNGIDDDLDGMIDETDGFTQIGGVVPDHGINCKPNYPSVMSYGRQLPTYLSNFVPHYSEGLMDPINEATLDENVLVKYPGNTAPVIPKFSSSPEYDPLQMVIGHPGGTPRVEALPAAGGITETGVLINWNGIGGTTDVSTGAGDTDFDVNDLNIPDACDSSPGQEYFDRDDYHNIDFNFRGVGGADFDGHPSEIVTPDIDLSIILGAQNAKLQYGGQLSYHTINPTGDGTDGEDPVDGIDTDGDGLIDEDGTGDGIDQDENAGALGGVVNLSFQYFSCNWQNVDDPKCIDTNHIVMEEGYYVLPSNNEFGQVADEDEDEKTLEVVPDKEIFIVVEKVAHIPPDRIDLPAFTVLMGPFGTHELSDFNFIYHFFWNTNDPLLNGGPGTYALSYLDGGELLLDRTKVAGFEKFVSLYTVPPHDFVDNDTGITCDDLTVAGGKVCNLQGGDGEDDPTTFTQATILVTLAEAAP